MERKDNSNRFPSLILDKHSFTQEDSTGFRFGVISEAFKCHSFIVPTLDLSELLVLHSLLTVFDKNIFGCEICPSFQYPLKNRTK